MPRAALRFLLILIVVLGAAFVLRLYRLDAVPLRGDEAFAVRYWAAPPGEVVHDPLDKEPHPLGTFFTFWAWKQLAGSSELAMRTLPLLGNLIGLAATAALGRQLFKSDRVAVLAAALWAVHPFQIWHAQDVRNYAIWAGLSPLAMALFLRAVHKNRPRDWMLYILAETAALYMFFLESLFLLVQAAYLLLVRRERSTLRRAVLAWAVLGVLLIPWFIQLGILSTSGYRGATEHADPIKLITWFLPVLIAGREFSAPWDVIVPLAWAGLVVAGLRFQGAAKRVTPRILSHSGLTPSNLRLASPLRPSQRGDLSRFDSPSPTELERGPGGEAGQKARDSAYPKSRLYRWLAVWIVLPALLLLIAATRMSVSHPRYLIAVTPALLLLTARTVFPPNKGAASSTPLPGTLLRIAVLIIPLLGLGTLRDYYRGINAKSPDWPALAAYLEDRARPGDLIVQTLADPAFGYYYHGGVQEFSLDPEKSHAAQIQPTIDQHQTFWLIGRSADAEAFMNDHLQEVSFHTLSNFSIIQFRQWVPVEDESEVKTDIRFGEIARLVGYTIQGPDQGSRAITVLLYWEPLARSETIDYKVFAHLIGPPHPDGNPLWDQEDHPPLHGFASTLAWDPGTLLRDPYHLLENPAISLPAGSYRIEVGFYDPATNARLPVVDENGNAVEDSYPLMAFDWPLR